jgi:hypothetical protein
MRESQSPIELGANASLTDRAQDERIADLDARSRRRENISLGIAVIGAVIALAAAGISYLQWRVMHEQLADARAGTKEANAMTQRALKSAESQADSLRVLAGTTRDLVTATERTLVWSERAWVHCDGVFSDPPAVDGGNPSIAGRPVKLTFLLTNNGRSPAERVVIEGAGEVVPTGKRPNLRKRLELVVREHATIPNAGELRATSSLVTRYSSPHPAGPLTDAMINNFASGRTRLFAFGRMSFHDVFGGEHWLTFCFYYLPGYGWTRYELGNDAGEGRPPWRI